MSVLHFKLMRELNNSLLNKSFTKDKIKPKLSRRAKEVIDAIDGEFTRANIQDLLMWDRMKIKRTIEELIKGEMIIQTKEDKPFKYKMVYPND